MSKEISLKKFLIVLSLLVLLELLIFLGIIPLIKNRQELKNIQKYCLTAVCSEDNEICYSYALKNNKTVVTWRGDCSTYFK